MDDRDISDEEIREMDQKEFRKEFPSGWMELTRYETLVMIIDALLEAPANREFSASEISNKSGVSKRSIKNRIDILVDLGVVDEWDEGRDNPRYSINNDSPITRKLYDLNITVQQINEGSMPKTIDGTVAKENANTGKTGKENKYNVNIPEGNPSSSTRETSGGFSPADMAGS